MRLNKLPEYLRMMPWLASKSRWIVIAVTRASLSVAQSCLAHRSTEYVMR